MSDSSNPAYGFNIFGYHFPECIPASSAQPLQAVHVGPHPGGLTESALECHEVDEAATGVQHEEDDLQCGLSASLLCFAILKQCEK